jgi:hypothetical protein
MRVIDRRGIFVRPAGQNSKYKMANNAPYDGLLIGKFLGDAIRNITGHTTSIEQQSISDGGAFHSNYVWATAKILTSTVGFNLDDTFFSAANSVPTALENRPASISAQICITY